MRLRFALALVASLFLAALSDAGEVTVVYYNIKFLDANKLASQGNRAQRLKEVIAETKGDVFGLSEIKDRKALEAVFPPSDWGILIDDDSGNTQDNAIVFKKSKLEMVGAPADLKATDAHFLFPTASDEKLFPGRRDVLFATLRDKASDRTFVVMVVHLKARVGGRDKTQWQRVGAARKILDAIETRFDGKPLTIGGDWNDNPDDVALNILETGDPNATFGGPKAGDPVFLTNLMEPLLNDGHVSHGKTPADVTNGKINTKDPNSRERNKNGLGKNTNTGDILFDQILVSDELRARHVPGSTKVFDGESAVKDGGDNAASDHLPVLAKFNFPNEKDTPPAPAAGGVRIAALLPNPAGDDAGKEEVHLKNTSGAAIDLQGWQLIDKGGSTFRPTGTLAPGATLKIVLPDGKLPLNNTGDTVTLFDATGKEIHTVTYTKQQAGEGVLVLFP